MMARLVNNFFQLPFLSAVVFSNVYLTQKYNIYLLEKRMGGRKFPIYIFMFWVVGKWTGHQAKFDEFLHILINIVTALFTKN